MSIAYQLDVSVLLIGGREIDGKSLSVRVVSAHPDAAYDQTHDLLDTGVLPVTEYRLGEMSTPAGTVPVYLTPDDGVADADLIQSDLIQRIAEDEQCADLTILLTISGTSGMYTVRLSHVIGIRVRVWEVGSERGPRLLDH